MAPVGLAVGSFEIGECSVAPRPEAKTPAEDVFTVVLLTVMAMETGSLLNDSFNMSNFLFHAPCTGSSSHLDRKNTFSGLVVGK